MLKWEEKIPISTDTIMRILNLSYMHNECALSIIIVSYFLTPLHSGTQVFCRNFGMKNGQIKMWCRRTYIDMNEDANGSSFCEL